MPYRLVKFTTAQGTADLMYLNPHQDHSPANMDSTILRSIGGVVDARAGQIGRSRPQTLTASGEVWGDDIYLVDERCDTLVDEAGNYILGGDYQDDLMTQLSILREQVLWPGQLVRERMSDGVHEWRNARFLEMQQPQEYTDIDFRAIVTCSFEMIERGWRAEQKSVFSASLPNTIIAPLIVQNPGGMTVEDAVVTISAATGPITQININNTVTPAISLRWTGSLAAGQQLVIDCGAATVRKGGTDAYVSGFIQPDHGARTWLPLPKGTTTLLMELFGGTGAAKVEFYSQNP